MTASFFIESVWHGSFNQGGAVTQILSGYSCKVSFARDNLKNVYVDFQFNCCCCVFYMF